MWIYDTHELEYYIQNRLLSSVFQLQTNFICVRARYVSRRGIGSLYPTQTGQRTR